MDHRIQFATFLLLLPALLTAATIHARRKDLSGRAYRRMVAQVLTGTAVVALIGGLTTTAHADGITWVSRTSAADNGWQSVTWGGPTGQEKFVAVASTGTGNRVMTSPDGITWTSRTSAANNPWQSVTWGGPAGQQLFVAVASLGTGNRVMTSPDGITWTSRTSAGNEPWISVTWGGPAGQQLFVAVAQNSASVMTSPDGITWTLRAQYPTIKENYWQSVTWGGPAGQELFVAVAFGAAAAPYGDTTHMVMTSPDGITWTGQSTPLDSGGDPYALYSVSWGGPTGQEKFVAVDYRGINEVLTSPDGTTWTPQTAISGYNWRSVTWGGPTGQEKFVAVASSGTGTRVMTSPDGTTWTVRTSASNNYWNAVTWGNGIFVATASSGTGNRVMTSGTPIILPTTTTTTTATTTTTTTAGATTTTVAASSTTTPTLTTTTAVIRAATNPGSAVLSALSIGRILGSSTASAGSSVRVTATGFTPGETIGVYITGRTRALTTLVANSSGRASATITIPGNLSGTRSVSLYGFESKTGKREEIAISAGSRLPITGTGTSPLWLGILSATIGAGLLVTRRRRNRA